ncbi:sialic acid-binding Ig-like lectin 5 [Pseudoliparis swirei]|uniref:sialic acid-binding Ig-like lectin 5 n=1 Tax=Pseudoliparis swirei TaxID=2059687 RepID=UPI0024BE7DF8|nr:sialic acid-binding Ig-like lectin 5 [Pseudoliparis swirei]
MFVLIWTALLFCVRDVTADTGESVKGLQTCGKGFCITLSEGEITAEAGLCVVIPCSFTTGHGFTPQYMVWFKCEPFKTKCGDIIFHTNKNNKKVQSEFLGRVSLLEPDVMKRNCSIIINNLTESDSGFYQLRVNGATKDKKDGFTFSTRATVSVKALTQKPSVLIPPLTEGRKATLTCTAPGLCSGSDPEITWRWRGAGEKDSHITGNITGVTQRRSSTLTFNPSAEHHGTNVTCKVSFTSSITTEETETLNVAYVKDLRTTGNTSVEEGETLNLTCSVESFPPALITWTMSSETNGHNETERTLQNDTESFMQTGSGTNTLSISNVTADASGKYMCRAKYLNITLVKSVDVKVIWFSNISKSSGCEVQSGVLTCVCVSEGFPLPTITWPLLESHAEHSVTTSKSGRTVVSVTVSVKDRNDTTVECVSSNALWEAKENLTVSRIKESKLDDLLYTYLITFVQPQVIVAFLIGTFLSAATCCLALKCCRSKQKNSGDTAEALEMVKTRRLALIDAGQGVEGDQEKSEEGAQAAGGDVEPREAEYSDVKFSLLKRKSPTGEEVIQETTDSEYAEIKKENRAEGRKEEEEKEAKRCMPKEKEEGGQDVAVYSNVNEIMAEEEGLCSLISPTRLLSEPQRNQQLTTEKTNTSTTGLLRLHPPSLLTEMADVFRSLNLLETLKESVERNKLSDVKDAVEDLLISRLNLAVIGERGDEKDTFINSLRGLGSVALEDVAGYPNPRHPDFRLWDLPPAPSTSPFEPKGYMERVRFARYNAVFMTFSQAPQANAVEVFLEARYFLLLASAMGNETHLEGTRKASLEALASQGVARPKVYLVRPAALEKLDFPGLLEDMGRDLPEIRAHALLLALPTLTSTVVTQKKEAFKALVWAAASLSGGVSAIPVPFVASMVDCSVALRILGKAQLGPCT